MLAGIFFFIFSLFCLFHTKFACSFHSLFKYVHLYVGNALNEEKKMYILFAWCGFHVSVFALFCIHTIYIFIFYIYFKCRHTTQTWMYNTAQYSTEATA